MAPLSLCNIQILLPLVVHLEERLTINQSLVEPRLNFCLHFPT